MGKFKPTNIKGAADTLPAEQIIRNRVIDILKRNFELHGFVPIETAMLNYMEVLGYKYESDAEIVREIYKIKDQGDRDLGLRFDLTVPFAKFIATNRDIKMPFRRYEIGKVWRNGPVKAGRLREFYQCDIDVVGQKGVEVEAELIAMAVKCYLELGITPLVKYGNRKVLSSLIPNNTEKVIAVIDKMEKISKKELETELEKLISKAEVKKLLVELEKGIRNEEVEELSRLLDEMGVSEYCAYTPSLARGLNVYTGTVWEVFDKNARIAGSLGGGGRYDNIITDWVDNGLEYPAVGMAFGLEPIMYLLQELQVVASPVDLLIISMKNFVQSQAVADRFRAAGKRVLILSGMKVGKAFEYADKVGIPSVAVVGEKELSDGRIRIKDMATGGEQEVEF
ncbi:MAG: histidine--tRNA ligase [Firmicutes bacterium]|nr:histidine--tRNA ligase [Bacillota bacterium]